MIPTNTWRLVLAVLLGFIALNAIGGAVYGLAGAEGVPLEWLEGSPFHSYVVPSLILLLAVGGTALAASTACFLRAPRAGALSGFAGGVLVLWIAVQVAIIGYVSWLQPTMLLAGGVIIGVARRLDQRNTSS